MKKCNISSNNSGVSEIIGTILLLGISVTLFSVIYIFVLSVPTAPTTPSSNIACSLNETSLILTHGGGSPLSVDSKIKIMIDGELYITKTIKECNLSEETKNNSYWGFGEQPIVINFSEYIPENSLEYTVEVMVIDVGSNSIVMDGTKLITITSPIIGTPNRAPTFSNPSPANASTGVNRYHATNVTVSDLDGNSTIVCFWYSTTAISGPWIKAQQNNSVVANTTVKDVNSSYSSGWNTPYWWKVTAYDGHVNSSVIYTFTTKPLTWSNRAPTFSNPSPANASTGVNRYHATNVTVSDLDGNSTIVCFWYSLSDSPYSWTKAQQNNSVVANTTVRDIYSSYSSSKNNWYWWKVTAYDGHVNSSAIYKFRTGID